MNRFPVIRDRKIRVAVVGCGRISRNHFGAIEQHASALELVAVCDTNSEVLSEVTAKHGVPGYTDMEDMLKGERIDLVAICTPSGLHPQQAILAARYKVHAMTEKPMATRWQDGLRMVRACDEANVRLFVVKQNRRNQTLQLLKSALDKGRFGKIYNVAVNVFWTRPQSYYDQGDGWRGTWEFDGGAFMNQASHYVDLLHWLLGPVESVMCYTATQARRIEAEDSGVTAIRWRSGALGTLNVSMLTYPQNLEGSITILGENGTVRVGGVAVNDIQLWKFADQQPEDTDVNSTSFETTSVYGFGHPLYYGNVVQTLRGDADAETDGRSGLRSLELLVAMYRSSRDGVRVSLPLDC